MNQTRVFLIFAWLMVATLLWMEWTKERAAPPPAPAPVTGQATAPPAAPSADPGPAPTPLADVPAAPGAAPAPAVTAGVEPAAPVVTVTTDVLRLRLSGGAVHEAQLLRYPQTTEPDSPPVRLFDEGAADYAVARTGWAGAAGAAPGPAIAFVPADARREYVVPAGAAAVEIPFVWTGPDGVTIRRTWTVPRNGYAVAVRDEVANAGTAPWEGYVYRQLLRVPPPSKGSMLTNPQAISFSGATWYSTQEKYEKRKFADFVEDGPLDRQVTGGWIGLSEHYFLSAWVPQADQAAIYSLSTQGNIHGIEARGPRFTVAPGQSVSTRAQLWVGPKLQERLADVAPGLELTLDYGIFTVLAKPIAWLLAKLHLLTSNWGWAIVLLVVLIKLAMYPLSAAQYKSMARMRRFQPRIEQLKERYGDDRQKFQMAMMELYKKEKINPVGGCLPVLLQMPIFFALYWVLLESVELRQAVWIPGWIDDLTARDPYFVLPIVNAAVMWATQKLSPAPGMDPMQRKMMQLMPLVFGVMMALFPAGLVLYWVTNGTLGLLQQWWNTKRYSEAPART